MNPKAKKYSYPKYFDRDGNQEIFHSFNGEEVTQLERYLRFMYSAKSLFRYIRGTHFNLDIQIPHSQGFGEGYRNGLWAPRKGKPYILILTSTNTYLTLPVKRAFEGERLYEKFKEKLVAPVSALELNVQSGVAIDKEVENIIKVFTRACNDGDWESKLPKLSNLLG